MNVFLVTFILSILLGVSRTAAISIRESSISSNEINTTIAIHPIDYHAIIQQADSLGRHLRREYELGYRSPPHVDIEAAAQYITQPIDHFDPTNTNTFQQRYFVNDSVYDGHGPVFC